MNHVGRMNDIIEQHRPELSEACRNFGVERLEVFGSAARSDYDPRRSDVDFIVRFRSPGAPGYADRYLGLAERLEQMLGRPVDLITERSLRNPLFVQAITQDRTTVYAT